MTDQANSNQSADSQAGRQPPPPDGHNNTDHDTTDFSCGIVPMRQAEDGSVQFLLVKHNAGHWAFPKGHPEKNETNVQTATRELAEETGLTRVEIRNDVPFDEQYLVVKSSGKRVLKTVRYFLGDVPIAHSQPVADPSEIAEAHWLDEQAAIKRITFAEGTELFERVLAHLKR